MKYIRVLRYWTVIVVYLVFAFLPPFRNDSYPLLVILDTVLSVLIILICAVHCFINWPYRQQQ